MKPWSKIRIWTRALGLLPPFKELESNEETHALIQAAHDAFIALDDSGRIVEWNRQAENTFGWSKSDVHGTMLSDTIVPPRFREAHCAGLTHYLKTSEGPVLNRRQEFMAIHRDGHEFPIELAIYPFQQKDRVLFGAFIHDISDRIQAQTVQTEEKLNSLRAEMEQKLEDRTRELSAAYERAQSTNRLKDKFLSMLSHELRTPIGVIQGYIDMLLEGGLTEEEVQTSLITIHRNTRIQTQIIADLLDVSSIITGKLKLNSESLRLEPVLTTAIESARAMAGPKQIRILSRLDSSTATVRGDARRLQQVFSNLLNNAIKFTPRGGQIEVHLKNAHGEAIIEVVDNGKGVDPAVLPHIYDRFRQEDPGSTRRFGGLGLGLAIVRHIVEAHGGTVAAESEGLGKGARFSVRLPLLAASSDAALADHSSTALENLARTMALKDRDILVVDDQIDTRKMLGLILEHAGAHVFTASNVAEAVELYESFHPVCVITDIGIPGHDGFELIAALKTRAAQLKIPLQVVALTTRAENTMHERILNAGFAKHLTKPIHPEDLVRELAALIVRT